MEEKKKRVMVTEDVEEKVRDYAKRKGLRILRGRGVLIEKGLEAVKEK